MQFWEKKALNELNQQEWEALCDGCGRCCLIKLEDVDTGEVFNSDVRCRLLDDNTCRCTDYGNRKEKVPDCIKLTPANVGEIPWIPVTCAYRRLAEGRGLAWWHPLISGDPDSVRRAGVSVHARTVGEAEVAPGEWEAHAVDWPDWEPEE
ncbi:MAG TPA: YcgN family cysteine cluster protein [Devosia sp.]|nr:YcgN family cysteine cluster protein [Devosia sp.]